MKEKYEKELKKNSKREIWSSECFKIRYDGDELKCKVQNYLKAVPLRRRQVKFAIAIAIAEALIKSNLYYILFMLDLTSPFSVPSLFWTMVYKKWAATTGKVKVTEKVLKEINISLLAQYSAKSWTICYFSFYGY